MYYRQNAELTYVLWKDSKIVSLLSSAHSGFRNKEFDHVQRKFSVDGIKASDTHWVAAPPQAMDYIESMGGVDRSDQLRAYYTTARKSMKWHMQMVYFLLDIAQVNGFICYKTAPRTAADSEPDHGRFVMDLAEELIGGFEMRAWHRQDTRVRVLPADSTSHAHVHMNATFARQCVGCLAAGRRGRGGMSARAPRTVYGCSACRQHLCMDCFYRYENFEIISLENI
jgi:hypothetical protein